MPTYRGTALFRDTTSGMAWSITNHRAEANPAAFLASFNSWNTIYMGICSDTVEPQAFRVSDVAIYRDITIYPRSSITTQQGSFGTPCTEIGSYAQWRGNGGPTTMSSAAWKLHGVNDSLVANAFLNVLNVAVQGLDTACLVYFRQYRPLAGARVPPVNPPVAFVTGAFRNVLYFRRLGRPLVLAGQQRSYLRT